MTIIGLNGKALIDDSPMAQAKRHVKWLLPVLKEVQDKAMKQRSLFGPFELTSFQSGEYTVEYEFLEDDDYPQILNIFYAGSIFGEDFMEYLFMAVSAQNTANYLKDDDASPSSDL